MIRHGALFRFREDVAHDEITALLAGYRELGNTVDGILDVAVGPNGSTEGLSKGFDHVIVIDFVDADAVEEYLSHPAHQALADRLIPCLDGGLEGSIPFDLSC